MFRNHVKFALRNLLKNKLQSSINIAGLAIGLASVLCIAAYIQSEYSVDGFHEKKDQLFRLGVQTFQEEELMSEGNTYTAPIGPAMKEEIPGVKNYTRYRIPKEAYLSSAEKSLKVDEVIYADSTFFSLFTFDLKEGNPDNALVFPNSLVLTESTAERLFGQTDVIGEIIHLNNGISLEVTGIVANVPPNSHIRFNALVSFSTLYQDPNNYMDWNGGKQYITYVQLEENTVASKVEKQLTAFMWNHINEDYAKGNWKDVVHLQSLSGVHLKHNPYSKSLCANLYFIGGIAVLLVLIACINFVNLFTALTGLRAQEVGVRKVLGASKASLVSQFLGEAFVLSGIAFSIALLLAEAFMPFMPMIFGKTLLLPSIFDWTTAIALFILLLLVGLGAGLYPSFFMASLDSLKSLKGIHQGPRNSGFRKGLVVFQFTVSIVLMVSTIVISGQLDFTRNKTLGFADENILVVPLVGEEVQSKLDAIQHELKQYPQVIGVTACSEIPGNGFTQNGYLPEGLAEPTLMHVVDVDRDFFEVFDLKLKKGRTISSKQPVDQSKFLVNEALVNELRWDNAIGKKISRNGEHEVVGIIEDFHFASLHEPIQPLIFTCSPWRNQFDYMAVKLGPGDLIKGVEAVSEVWQKMLPNIPLEHWFLDDTIDQIYKSEQQLHKAFVIGSGLSIFIALMGVFGLTTLSVQRRFKEIGIRKILGATTVGLVGLLSKDFLKLVVIAFLIASPLSYFFMEDWLQDFVYRIPIHWWVFALAGILAASVAFLTVGFQSVRAALAHPVESLRSE